MIDNNKEISFARGSYLENISIHYNEEKKKIQAGVNRLDEIKYLEKMIKKALLATSKDWNDWHWQLANRISDIVILKQCLHISDKYLIGTQVAEKKFRWGISPYYLSLVDFEKKDCPISMMSFPTEMELNVAGGEPDPMNEELTNPAGRVIRRYPDRLIINTTNKCASYCRFCQRRRLIGQKDKPATRNQIIESIDYIKSNKGIRDVLITGGDPLTLEDTSIEWILKEIYSISHVEYVRIGTRVPVTMPQRLTRNLIRILKKFKPLYINTHFNHPIEINKYTQIYVGRLADAGIPLGNQSVLLAGINNNHIIIQYLNQLLLMNRIKPYYLFHPKKVFGTQHFYCKLNEGIEIIKKLRGNTSGMAIPTYVLNSKNGLGKVPLLPEYVKNKAPGEYTITTWEGKEITYSD